MRKNKKSVIYDMKHMTLKQCLRIKENQYRSADVVFDYDPFEIEARIIELKMKQKLPKEVEPVIEFDHQLGALLPEGQYLLALIDYALKTHKGENMDKQITKVSVRYAAIPKGKRKEINSSYYFPDLDGHCNLTPKQVIDFEREFWQWVANEQWKTPPSKGRILVNFGKTDGEMIFVELFPKKTILIQNTIDNGSLS